MKGSECFLNALMREIVLCELSLYLNSVFLRCLTGDKLTFVSVFSKCVHHRSVSVTVGQHLRARVHRFIMGLD